MVEHLVPLLEAEQTDLLLVFNLLFLAQLLNHEYVKDHLDRVSVDIVLLQDTFHHFTHFCDILFGV